MRTCEFSWIFSDYIIPPSSSLYSKLIIDYFLYISNYKYFTLDQKAMLQYIANYKKNNFLYFSIFFVFFYSIYFLTLSTHNTLISYNTELSFVCFNKYTNEPSSRIVLKTEATVIEEESEYYFYNLVDTAHIHLKTIKFLQFTPTKNNLNKLTDSLISYLVNRLTFHQ